MHALKIVNKCCNTNIYSYLETPGGQSLNQYLNVVHFFNTGVNQTSVAAQDSHFSALVSIMCCTIATFFWFNRVLDRGPEQRESKLTVLSPLNIIILISFIIIYYIIIKLLIMENHPSQNWKRNSLLKSLLLYNIKMCCSFVGTKLSKEEGEDANVNILLDIIRAFPNSYVITTRLTDKLLIGCSPTHESSD